MTAFYLKLLADTAQASKSSGITMIIMMVVLLAVMYFFMIRPSRKQEKEATAMRNNLQVGDEITTIGGIIGKIVSIKGETCTIETSKDRTKIRILKTAVKTVDVPAAVANGPIPQADEPAPENLDAPALKKEEEKEKKGFFSRFKKKKKDDE